MHSLLNLNSLVHGNLIKSHLEAVVSEQTVIITDEFSRKGWAMSSISVSEIPRQSPAAILYKGVSTCYLKKEVPFSENRNQ